MGELPREDAKKELIQTCEGALKERGTILISKNMFSLDPDVARVRDKVSSILRSDEVSAIIQFYKRAGERLRKS